MNQHLLYLALDIGSISIPLAFSFYAKAPFYKKWKFLFISTLVPGALFLAWDEVFTRYGVWGFNDHYLIGIKIGTLPIEEILFFICIPYACVFTYEAFKYLLKKDFFERKQITFTWILVTLLLVMGLINYNRLYTSITFIALACFLVYVVVKLKPIYLGRFYFTYLIILIPFFLVNGILTGSLIDEPVVWYNNSENLGIRLGTIPIEDIFYGMLLILMNIVLFEELQLRSKTKQQ